MAAAAIIPRAFESACMRFRLPSDSFIQGYYCTHDVAPNELRRTLCSSQLHLPVIPGHLQVAHTVGAAAIRDRSLPIHGTAFLFRRQFLVGERGGALQLDS